MTAKSMFKTVQMESILYIRGFFGPFFSLLFPLMMLYLFGSIYGNEPMPFYNGRGAMDVGVPAYLGMIIAVGGIMTLPLGLIEYQSSKAYKRFDATPVGKVSIIMVQISIYIFSCVLSSLILVAVGKLLYNIKIDGNWLAIIPAFLLSLACIFSIGFLITAVFKNTKISQLVSYLLYFLMLFTSGATIPAELFPENVKAITNILPLTHSVKLLQAAFSGNTLDDVWISVTVLSGVTIVCATVGVFSYRHRKWA